MHGVSIVRGIDLSGQLGGDEVLGLEKTIRVPVDLGPVLLEPEQLGQAGARVKDVAGPLVEGLGADSLPDLAGLGNRAGISMDQGCVKRLAVCIHGQTAQHLAAQADHGDSSHLPRVTLDQFENAAGVGLPPVVWVLLGPARLFVSGRVGKRRRTDRASVRPVKDCLDAAGADIAGQDGDVCFHGLIS